jgi:uncharacterized protein YndB with AHSA1/START domain
VPRYAAARTLLAPVEDVWAFVAEPYHLADWWPGVGGVQPDRRGLAPGARWQVQGSSFRATQAPIGFAMFRRPGLSGTLVVTDVVPGRRFAFQFTRDRVEAELELESDGAERTRAALAVEAAWSSVPRSIARDALRRLYDLVQTSASA